MRSRQSTSVACWRFPATSRRRRGRLASIPLRCIASGRSSDSSERRPAMLRTRLYLGLLPLLLLIIATGGYAIYVCSDLAGSLSRDLVANYRAVLACQQMRTSATLMTSALSPPRLGDAERRAFEEHRGAFNRELMAQSQASVGSSRAGLVAALDGAFKALSEEGERQLRVGGATSMGEGMQLRNAA